MLKVQLVMPAQVLGIRQGLPRRRHIAGAVFFAECSVLFSSCCETLAKTARSPDKFLIMTCGPAVQFGHQQHFEHELEHEQHGHASEEHAEHH